MGRLSRTTLGMWMVVLLVGAFVFGAVAQASAFTGPVIVTYSKYMQARRDTNGAQLWAKAGLGAVPSTWYPPTVVTNPATATPPWSTFWGPWSTPGSVFLSQGPGPWRKVHYGESLTVPSAYYNSPACSWFEANFKLRGTGVKTIVFRFWYTTTVPPNPPSIPTTTTYFRPGTYVAFGWSSPPSMSNPAEIPDEDGNMIANTSDLVLSNIKYAQGPPFLPDGETTLDNPEVQAAFAASPDTTRAGPIVLAPGESSDFAAVDPSIKDPVKGVRTLLMKGEAVDASGTASPFLIAFADDPDPIVTPTPSSSWWSLSALVVLVMAAFYVVRRRLPVVS